MIGKRRITEHQILFSVSFLLGILWITVIARGKIPENPLMDQALENAFLTDGWNRKELFFQCLYSRGILFVILGVLTFTFARTWAFRIVTIWLGISFGSLIKMFFLWYGVKGIGLFFAALCPHMLLYWMAYGLLYWQSCRNRRMIFKNYAPLLLIAAVVIMGIFLESYVNPMWISGYLKLFF